MAFPEAASVELHTLLVHPHQHVLVLPLLVALERHHLHLLLAAGSDILLLRHQLAQQSPRLLRDAPSSRRGSRSPAPLCTPSQLGSTTARPPAAGSFGTGSSVDRSTRAKSSRARRDRARRSGSAPGWVMFARFDVLGARFDTCRLDSTTTRLDSSTASSVRQRRMRGRAA